MSRLFFFIDTPPTEFYTLSLHDALPILGAATVGTLVIVGIIVAALALYVFAIGLGLKRLSGTLGKIVVGLRGIKEQTRPVNPVLGAILGNVTEIEDALDGVLKAVGEALGAAPAPEAPSMADAVASARGGRGGRRAPAPAGGGFVEPEYDDGAATSGNGAGAATFDEPDYDEEPEPASVGSSSMAAAVAAARQ